MGDDGRGAICCPEVLSTTPSPLEASVRDSGEVPGMCFPVVICYSGSVRIEQSTERMQSEVTIVLTGVRQNSRRWRCSVLEGSQAEVEGALEGELLLFRPRCTACWSSLQRRSGKESKERDVSAASEPCSWLWSAVTEGVCLKQ